MTIRIDIVHMEYGHKPMVLLTSFTFHLTMIHSSLNSYLQKCLENLVNEVIKNSHVAYPGTCKIQTEITSEL